jgi:hypothetical protein
MLKVERMMSYYRLIMDPVSISDQVFSSNIVLNKVREYNGAVRQLFVDSNKRGNVRITNIEARSPNNFCRGKGTSFTHCECVSSPSYPACRSHAPYHIVIYCLSGSTAIFHIVS